MYTTKQAAEKLGIKLHTVAEYIRKGYLKAEKFGRDWMIDDKEVDKRSINVDKK